MTVRVRWNPTPLPSTARRGKTENETPNCNSTRQSRLGTLLAGVDTGKAAPNEALSHEGVGGKWMY
jgi:hypothetical protein